MLDFFELVRLAKGLVAEDRTELDRSLLGLRFLTPLDAETLRKEQLLELLAARVSANELSAIASAAFVHAMELELRTLRARRSLLLDALDEATPILAREGVPFVLIKGFHLADRFYGGIEQRSQRDLDILVQKRDRRTIRSVLAKLGFRSSRTDPHSITLERGDVQWDVHWQLRRCPAYQLDAEAVWETTRRHQMGSRSFLVLSDEQTLNFLGLSLAQDIERGSARIRHMLDLWVVLRAVSADMDWAAFLEARRRENVLPVWINALALTLDIFEAHDVLVEAAQMVERHRDRVQHRDRDEALALIQRQKGHADNRLWFYGLYPGSVLGYQAWTIGQYLPRNLLRFRPSWILTASRMGAAYFRARRHRGRNSSQDL